MCDWITPTKRGRLLQRSVLHYSTVIRCAASFSAAGVLLYGWAMETTRENFTYPRKICLNTEVDCRNFGAARRGGASSQGDRRGGCRPRATLGGHQSLLSQVLRITVLTLNRVINGYRYATRIIPTVFIVWHAAHLWNRWEAAISTRHICILRIFHNFPVCHGHTE